MRQPLYKLFDAEFERVDVVDAGDNPVAKILIQKARDEQEAKMNRVSFADIEEELGYVKARVQGSDPSLTEAQAFAKATDHPRVAPLIKAYREQRSMEIEGTSEISKADARAARETFMGRVEALRKLRPELTENQLWGEVQRDDPELYQRAKG